MKFFNNFSRFMMKVLCCPYVFEPNILFECNKIKIGIYFVFVW